MPTNKEIEITLTLKDEASKKIQSFRSAVKEFSKETKDSLTPILQLRRTWHQLALAGTFVTGAFITISNTMKKYREELDLIDKLSIRMGVSTEYLSKKIYGFNIATEEARAALTAYQVGIKAIQNFGFGLGGKIVNAFGEDTITAKRAEMGQERLKKIIPSGWRRGMLNLGITPPLSAEETKKTQVSREEALKAIGKEADANKEVEALKKGLIADTQQKTQQLIFSTYTFKKATLAKEVDLLRQSGVDEITARAYTLVATKRMEEDRTIVLTQQQALRLKAEGDTLAAIRLEQKNALIEFKRQFGGDGEMVAEFTRNQQAMLKQARLTYWGLKNESQMFHDSFVSIINSMTNTFSDVFYNTILRETKSLKEAFNSFGQSVIKTMTDLLAEHIKMKIIMGVGNIAGSVGGLLRGTNALAAGSYNIGGQQISATTHTGIGLGGTYVGMAEGGVGIVRKPTLFLAGESGPEQYKFTPLNKTNGPEQAQIHYHSTIVIKAWDFSDIYNNKEEIKAIINESLRLQGSVQKSIRSYGG